MSKLLIIVLILTTASLSYAKGNHLNCVVEMSIDELGSVDYEVKTTQKVQILMDKIAEPQISDVGDFKDDTVHISTHVTKASDKGHYVNFSILKNLERDDQGGWSGISTVSLKTLLLKEANSLEATIHMGDIYSTDIGDDDIDMMHAYMKISCTRYI